MQETQTLKSQIISILDNLPLDSLKVLAEFALFLKTRVDWFSSPLESTPTATIDVPLPKQNVMRIASPHLVHRNQMADFKLEIIAESTE